MFGLTVTAISRAGCTNIKDPVRSYITQWRLSSSLLRWKVFRSTKFLSAADTESILILRKISNCLDFLLKE